MVLTKCKVAFIKFPLRRHAHVIYTFSQVVKIEKRKSKIILIFFLLLLKAQIVATRYNRLGKAVQTSTHILCFEAKISKIGIPLHTPVLPYKSGI